MINFDKILKEEKLVLEKILNAFNKNENIILTYFNQHCFNIYCENQEYKQIVDKHFSIHLDGIGIYFAAKFLSFEGIELYNATDMNKKIISYLGESNIPLFVIGGSFSQEEMQHYSSKKNLNIVGYQNGFFQEPDVENLIRKIDNSKARAVLVGMGVPKQEFFAFELSKQLELNLIHCVGNFFEFSLGKKPRAPKFLRNVGIEWLFRLLTEPKRLWKRYLAGIPIFIFRIIKLKLSR